MQQVVSPKVRGFICTTAHPQGCQEAVSAQIKYIQSKGNFIGPKRVLVIGASTGYGLASRIALAFGAGAKTIGVSFEKPAKGKRTASAGWYNTAAFEQFATQQDLYAKSLNGDAFSNDMKQSVCELVKADLEQIDCLVYSLASPRRIHPDTGESFSSVLKPLGQSYSNKTVDTASGAISTVTLESANDDEIQNTVTVMGGDDWQRWVSCLREHGLLAENFTTVAYSYIGPELTYPIYTNGTIGQAKTDLQHTADKMNDQLQDLSGRAFISVNKALVTQSSSAIPVVPLYMSILFKIMQANGTNEGCIEQMYRLYAENLFSQDLQLDDERRIRLDDLEMQSEVQAAVADIWQQVDSGNLNDLADLSAYQRDFYRLFGFQWPGVDYDQEVEVDVAIASIETED
jgi:enoyl-[acyl-carrier protein] reductase / trans-2-enoyl-CoA reductase (NAD+)